MLAGSASGALSKGVVNYKIAFWTMFGYELELIF